MKKTPNDRMLDKSGEFFLKLPVSIMHIVFDFRRVQLVGSLKVYSSYWWVLLGSWSVPTGFWSIPAGFWSVLVLVYVDVYCDATWGNLSGGSSAEDYVILLSGPSTCK